MDFATDQHQQFSSVTQCPHCGTAFHIGLSQLDAADGRVRCGGCLRVFNAREHFLVEQKRLFDDEQDAQNSQATATDQSRRARQATQPPDPVSVDLLGAEIIEDDGPVILGDFNHDGGQSIPRDAILNDQVEHFNRADYQPASAEDVLGEDTDSEYLFDADAEDFDPSCSESEFEQNLSETISELQEIAQQRVDHPEYQEERRTDVARQESPIEPKSEFFIGHSQAKKQSGRTQRSFWSLAFIISVLAVPLQLLYRPPAELLENAWFREIGQSVCAKLGCEIPVYTHLDAIRISGFIEPHSRYQNSLVVKIDLLNSAASTQPFPNIAVWFRNMAGEITASREFSPGDYLRGEARGYSAMPVNRNVQIELEILDPGEQSVSYEIGISKNALFLR